MNQTKNIIKTSFALFLIGGLIVGIFQYTIHTQQTTKSENSEKSALVLKTAETQIAQPAKSDRAPASIGPQIEREISQDFYKKNIRDKEFYAQILDQLHKNAADEDVGESSDISYDLSQNIILFDHVLGYEHPLRRSFVAATEKMLQEKQSLNSELNSKKMNGIEFKDRLHAAMEKYQTECADFLNDQDFAKLSSHLGL